MFNQTVVAKGRIVVLPSLTRFSVRRGTQMYLCALPVAKGMQKRDFGEFVTRLVLLDQYFAKRQNTFRSYLFILICESSHQAEEVATVLHSMYETRTLGCLYAIDIITADEEIDPLQMLYDISISDEGEAFSNLISLRSL